MTKDKKISIICHSIALATVIGLLIFLCFKNSDGVYYDLLIDQKIGNADNWFGILFMVIGEYPQYLLIPIGGTILFYNSDFFKGTAGPILFKILSCVIIAAGMYLWVTMGTKVYSDGIPAQAAFGVFAAIFYGTIFLGVGALVPKETMHKLFKWGVFILTFVAVSYVVMTIIKKCWCRMRYRDMLKIASFDGFSPWYQTMVGRDKVEGFDYTSFPSGHTSAAVHLFVICLLPNYFKKLDKEWIRYTLYGVSTAFVLIVAIARVINTAHFLSDTIMGGALTYAIFYALKSIFFKKGMFEFKKKELLNESIQE